MIAIINLTTGRDIRVSILEAYDMRRALKERGYAFTRDATVGDDWLAPPSRLRGKLFDPCYPAWEREIAPEITAAEIVWLEAAGAKIGGGIGIALHNHRAGTTARLAIEDKQDQLIIAAGKIAWTPAQWALAQAIMADPSLDFAL